MERNRELQTTLCYNLDPIEYGGLLDCVSQIRKSELRSILKEVEDNWGEEIALILTGSDGKGERHPQSKTEIILLSKNPNISECVSQKILDTLSETPEKDSFESIEIKNLGEEPLSFYEGNPSRVYPDRILGGYYLLGDKEIFNNARRCVVEEMSNPGQLGSKIRREISSQIKAYRKTMRTGVFRQQIVFDPTSGIQFYFEGPDWKENRMGLKMGPIRATQRKMDLLIAHITSGKIGAEEIAKEFPSNTSERFSFLSQRGIINTEEEEVYRLAYLWFLREYHHIQEIFKRSGKTEIVALPFNKEEFERYILSIEKFLELEI